MKKDLNDVKLRKFASVLQSKMSLEQKMALESCLSCKACGDACGWFQETGDQALHPYERKQFVKKVYESYAKPYSATLRSLGVLPRFDDHHLREQMDLFWQCTACGRCSMACPMGLSNRSITHLARAAYYECGMSGENKTLQSIDENTRKYKHSYGLSATQVLLRVGFMLEHQRVYVPMDVEGAECLFVCPAVGNTQFPDYGIKLPKLLNAMGVSYTMSSQVIDTGTEIEHIVDNHDLSVEMLMRLEKEAERLRVKKIIVAECGCDTRTFYADSAERLGRGLSYPVIHIDSLFLESIKSGKLPVEPVNQVFTFHDPCKMTRLSGMGDMERELLALVAPSAVEMEPHGSMNYCCNAGAGPMRLSENKALRLKVSRSKAEQIKQTGAEAVVTPCAVCMLSIEEIAEEYMLHQKEGRMSFMMFELVYAAAERALQSKGALRMMKRPAVFDGRSTHFRYYHTPQSIIESLYSAASYEKLYNWLENDSLVKRYIKDNPESESVLKAMQPRQFVRLHHTPE